LRFVNLSWQGNMNIKKVLAVAAMALLGGFGTAQASVMNFTSVGSTETVLIPSMTVGGATLNGSVLFTLTAITSNSASFAVTITNDSSGPGTNRLVSFGVKDVTPNLTGASANSGWDATLNTNFPGGFGTIELCVWDGANCSGGGSQGVAEGSFETFTLGLTTSGDFMTVGVGVRFGDPYSVKFQSVGTGGVSVEYAGCIQGTPDCGGTVTTTSVPVPEPAPIGLMGLMALVAWSIGAGAGRRKR
jgi:hypothetical protein